MDKTTKDLVDELEIAKQNVKILLKDSEASVDFHSITYWAERVEKLREEIKAKL